MSKISKKRLIKVLQGDLEQPITKESLLDRLANPPTQEEWIRGYWRWRRQMENNNADD